MSRSNPPLAVIDLAAAAIIAAGALGAYFLGMAPAQRAQATEAADREALTQAREQADEAAQKLKTSQSTLDKLKTQADAKDMVLHPASEIFARIEQITNEAESQKLIISVISPSAPVPGKRYNRVPIHLQGSGNFPEFSAFLAGLHASHADIQVTGFKVTGKPEDPKAPAAFDADLCWYTLPTAPGPADGNSGAAHGAGIEGNAGAASNGLSGPAAPGPAAPARNP
jgi:Tfp pilus assembly protein PilO